MSYAAWILITDGKNKVKTGAGKINVVAMETMFIKAPKAAFQ